MPLIWVNRLMVGVGLVFFGGGAVFHGLALSWPSLSEPMPPLTHATFVVVNLFFAVVFVLRVTWVQWRLSIALFTGLEVMGRWMPSRAPQWTAVTLGVFGVRALGLSLSFAGGAEFPVPQGALGTGEVRLGVELVELITFFRLQSESTQPVF